MKKISSGILRVALLSLCLGGVQKVSASAIDVFLSAPNDQSSPVTGTSTTETFGTTNQTTASYTSTIGTFTSTSNFKLIPADQYGGAGATGDYLVFGGPTGSSAPITITLTNPADYLGVWLSAADSNNEFSFYSGVGGTTLIGKFTTGSLLSLLGNSTVTAIDGSTTYASSSYYGNPNNRTQNAGQPYAYLDFEAVGTTITKIVLDNSGQTSTGFESDNYTVIDSPVTIPTSDVFVTAVPEPSRYAVLLCGLVFCLVGSHRFAQSWKRGWKKTSDLVGQDDKRS